MLYSPEDVTRWKSAQATILPFMERDVARYTPGSRIPAKLSRHLEADAAISLAEGGGTSALGYLYASSKNRERLWRDFISGTSERETVETLKQSGCGPIVVASMLGRNRAIETADLFLQVARTLKFDAGIKELGTFLHDVLRGESPAELKPSENVDQHLARLAIAFSLGDCSRISESILEGADDWAKYIRSDPGHDNSVCYYIGIAFVRLTREILDPNFAVEHVLLPSCILSSECDFAIGRHLIAGGG